MGKMNLAFIGIFLVGLATLLQMFVDYYQSEAQGVPMPRILQYTTIGIAVITLIAIYISLKSTKPVRR